VLSFGIPFWYSDYVQGWFVTQQVNEVIYSVMLNPAWVVSVSPQSTFTWMDLLKVVYLIGAVLFAVRLVIVVSQLVLVLKRKAIEKYEAFSFFGYSFVADTLQKRDTILAHEHVHVQQLHSFDVLLFEVIAIVNWFNPVVYFYKRDVKHIHEFIADEIASTKENSKADYAILLFSREFGLLNPHQLTNSFYNRSTLKRRVFMLQKEKSRQVALLKYGLILPLFISMLIFSSAWIAKNEGLEVVENVVLKEDLPYFKNDTLINVRGKVTIVNSEGQADKISLVVIKDNRKIVSKDLVSGDSFDFKDVPQNAIMFINVKDFVQVLPLNDGGFNDIKLDLTQKLDVQPKMLNGVEITNNSLVENNDEEIFTAVEEQPEYLGGAIEAFKFIAKNIKYPEAAVNARVQGKVFLKFVVKKDGTIGDIQVLKGIGFGCDLEAARVVKEFPRWTPGKQNGKPVNVWFTIPISFVLDGVPPIKDEQLGDVVVTAQAPPLPFSSQIPNPFLDPKKAITSKITLRGSDTELKDYLLVVDGVVKDNIDNLAPNDITSINVLKGEESAKIYGVTDKKGVLLISTIKAKPISNAGFEYYPYKALYLIEDEETTKEEVDAINPDKIRVISVYKGEEAIKKFGERGKNGVVQVLLKK
jgi:TonB family protein